MSHTTIPTLSIRRLLALCRKETYQIVRDPSSILIAFVMPLILLFVFGYGINLDANYLRIGLLVEDTGSAALQFEQTLRAGNAFNVRSGNSRRALMAALVRGEIRGMVIIKSDFSAKVQQGQGAAAIQVLADGSEPNTAQFVSAYVNGAWARWQTALGQNRSIQSGPTINVETRTWFNPSNVSRNFLVPGSIAVVMTIIGALLTSLVVAREWERGTMEALLATPVTKVELLLSKIIPYYVLGMAAMTLCLMVAVLVMAVPFRGSLLALFGISSLFLACALGQGLYLSTVLRVQFNAAQAALTVAFLPAMMLSGFVFEISSMPHYLQWLTRIIPARYFANSLQTLFQTDLVTSALYLNALYLSALGVLWLGLTALKTKRTLD
ncbi:ABC transporter permease [Undibacterium sp. SXout11W]|uniref:ABC transporter permease n=1 Tax=Undibacterium sp. SXout11W TaxID=3413050 RepID=UPI003BF1DBFD